MKGDVVVVLFPFTNYLEAKKRPAIVLMEPGGEDVVLAAVSATNSGPCSIYLSQHDFARGSLNRPSFIRFTALFTVEKSLIHKNIGTLTEAKRKEVVEAIYSLLQ